MPVMCSIGLKGCEKAREREKRAKGGVKQEIRWEKGKESEERGRRGEGGRD